MTAVAVTIDGAVGHLVLDRPERANAIDLGVLDDLESALERVEGEPAVRALVVASAHPRVFSGGGDIRAMLELPVERARGFVKRGQAVLQRLAGSRLVSIAAIEGAALGGGAELALACDLRVASEAAIFGFPEVGVGLIPGWGGTQRALRLAGPGRAKLAILTGRRLPAIEAARLGFVDVVVPPGHAAAEAQRLAAEIAAQSPPAVAAAKRALDLDLAGGLAAEAEEWLANFATADRREGLAAFLERRPPSWSGG